MEASESGGVILARKGSASHGEFLGLGLGV